VGNVKPSTAEYLQKIENKIQINKLKTKATNTRRWTVPVQVVASPPLQRRDVDNTHEHYMSTPHDTTHNRTHNTRGTRSDTCPTQR